MKVRRPFVIRDPVHGYLTVAGHERFVVDSAITQRLRRISQTGLTELVFPEARTSRFVHSLGAMNLASRFVVACIENADEKVRARFFKDVEEEADFNVCSLEELDHLVRTQGAISALRSARASFGSENDATRKKYRRLLALVESGLRFSALFHDLGHLPFSHDGEYALQEFVKRRQAAGKKVSEPLLQITSASIPPHEEIGHRMARLAIKALVPEGLPATRAAFGMGLKILDTPPPPYDEQLKPKASAIAWLHSLVDGEIDVDRADYLLRDGQALGLDFASYDVDRLVNNLVVEWDDDLGYITAVKESGLAALESYCLSRSRSTEIFIHHHKVAQLSVTLRYASDYAYETQKGKELLNFLDELATSPPDLKEDIERFLLKFSQFDDGWWIEVLRELREEGTSDPLLMASLNLILDRSRTFSSVWKRRGDLSSEEVKLINRGVDDFFQRGKGVNLAALRDDLIPKGILIAPFKFRPFLRRPSSTEPKSGKVTLGSSVMMVKTQNRGLQSACQVSPRIASLQQAWEGELHLYACTTSPEPNEARKQVIGSIQEKILSDPHANPMAQSSLLVS